MAKFKRNLMGSVLLALLLLVVGGVAAQDQVTLVVWDEFARPAESALIEKLHRQFEADHPGVTIKRESYVFDDLMKTLPLALTESNGPDVAKVNQGYTSMGALVEAGLIIPLDSYADKYKWWDRYAKVLHRRNTFSADGKQMGVGNLYGMSATAEVVGVYYHRDIFDKLGLKIPTTFAEFEALLKTVKDSGMTPIVFGSLDGWPAIHLYGAIQDAYSTTDALDNFIYRLPGGTFQDEANLKAAQTLVNWVDAGYLSPGYSGMDYDSATFGAFEKKDGAMWITGSWAEITLLDHLGASAEKDLGFFLVPPEKEGNPPINVGGVGLGYGISAKSQHPDLAAEYIDFITSPQVAETFLEAGYLPAAYFDPAKLTDRPLTADIVTAWNTISSKNAVGHYLDWTMPDIAADLQALMAKQETPDEFVAKVESDYVAGAKK